MIVFPNAKINLGLHVVAKRPDGFHNLETVFLPVGWSDVLEIIRSEKEETEFTQTGTKLFGDVHSNLCMKAYDLMAQQHGIGPVRMHLHKLIPIGAGLGGGSSDAAFTLLALNSVFQLNLSSTTLQEYASRLGSDCAFFIRNSPALATQKGDQFKAADVPLKGYFLVIVKPRVSIRTADAYGDVVPGKPENALPTVIKLPVTQWKDLLKNDFENSVFKKRPSIGKTKEKLYSLGALYASMSGSGSAVYGIFKGPVDLKSHFRGSAIWQSPL